jgi:hypothetical protein
VGVRAALVIGLDAGDGLVEPGGGGCHGRIVGQNSAAARGCWRPRAACGGR